MVKNFAKDFGSCCSDLGDAMQGEFEPFLRVEDNGVLYLVVGCAETEEGPAYFDQAVLFCPFCGSSLQTLEDIAEASVADPHSLPS